MIEGKNIIQAKLGRVILERVDTINLTTEEKSVSVQLKCEGSFVDEDGKIAGDAVKVYELLDFTKTMQEELIRYFKQLSKKFNNDLASEDSETF